MQSNDNLPDDSTNKSAIYFEQYQKGLTITKIAQMFNRSVVTVRKYLKQHDQYQAPGRGNRVTGKARKTRKCEHEVTGPEVLKTFYVPVEKLNYLKEIEGSFKSKVNHGLDLLIEHYNLKKN